MKKKSLNISTILDQLTTAKEIGIYIEYLDITVLGYDSDRLTYKIEEFCKKHDANVNNNTMDSTIKYCVMEAGLEKAIEFLNEIKEANIKFDYEDKMWDDFYEMIAK